MSGKKVNFKVVGVNQNYGVAYINFWADGATQERFGSDYGPYEVPMCPTCADMTEEELKEYIARFGVSIIERQKRALQVESAGVDLLFQDIIDTEISVIITEPTANTANTA
jgi:hypothetical protein